ncbi:E3 SUMO-protein ligase ZBED1 [Lepeophtheirus salmonis]|uniref:E3 SUMO-protein ligase ZBED1 n=1 Tax=Lepeophtheirus salmonis TaxID=72036 RepID=UPI001AEAB883|nr:E3 SUMO-protein ligase ZBED1-like [Lepeophtheirus salmonis]
MSQSRKRSEIWTHFYCIDGSIAECCVCKTHISCRAGSTKRLHRHLRTAHPTVPLEKRSVEPDVHEEDANVSSVSVDAPVPRASTESSIKHFFEHSLSPARQRKIDEELAKMIATDFQPFSVVEDKGFRNFTHALNQVYVIPRRKALSQNMIPDLYYRERASVQERVNRATSVCLTTESWTSRAMASFMSLTCHFIEDYKMASCLLDCFEFNDGHTSENLAEELLRVAKEWNVEKKVVACVTDNATNILKAVKILKWTHHPCLAHTINMIVRNTLKVIQPAVDKVKAIVEFFHRSTTATQKLESTQLQMGMPELKLKRDCVTRWNSTLNMIKRILESKHAVISTLAVINAPIDPLSQEEWAVLQEACTVLEPFEQVTVEISTESYVTASKMLILCKGLQRVTAVNQTSVITANVQELVDILCATMDRKFNRMEYNIILSETTILDPRFKKLAFNDTKAFEEAVHRITITAARLSHPTTLPGGQKGTQYEYERPHESDVWSLFKERVTEDSTRRNPSADPIMEVRSYLDEPLFQRSADPLNWWESKASVYPRLTNLMTRRLCIVATSVPSERIFSKTGQIITDRRSQISPSKMRHLVFLNANLQ